MAVSDDRATEAVLALLNKAGDETRKWVEQLMQFVEDEKAEEKRG